MDRIGVIGLGTMGSAMAGHLVRAGYPTTVWNRTPGRAAELVAAGAREGSGPQDVGRHADIVILSVSDTPDVEAVLFGRPTGPGTSATPGLADGLGRGSLVIDTSTISPAATREFAARLAERGISLVDAPVSGGSEGAQKATLTIFLGGGDDAAVERAKTVLAHLGKTITHFGPAGSGQAVKAVNQAMIAGVYLAVAEGIVLAMKAGLDPDKVVEALGGGVAGSWILANRSWKMVKNDYPLGFRTSLHLKDLGIALSMARELGVSLPVTGLAAQLETGLVARGYGDEDMSNLARMIRGLSGMPGLDD